MTPSSRLTDHEQRYRAALLHDQDASGGPPDRHWRVLLHLLTALPGLWEVTRARLDFVHGTVPLNPQEVALLSTSERALLEIAINLFSGRGAVDLARSIGSLDSARWHALVVAFNIYREFPPCFRPAPGAQTTVPVRSSLAAPPKPRCRPVATKL
jgi:hypothetical protein